MVPQVAKINSDGFGRCLVVFGKVLSGFQDAARSFDIFGQVLLIDEQQLEPLDLIGFLRNRVAPFDVVLGPKGQSCGCFLLVGARITVAIPAGDNFHLVSLVRPRKGNT